jgi:cation:H+ antiporter
MPLDWLWTFPSIIIAAFIIAWGAEAAQFLVSQGMALAILAWLQTLPEFAVEAAFAWDAGYTGNTDLVIANLTGSIRLLAGLGFPLCFFILFISERGKLRQIKLHQAHAVEVVGLLVPICYFCFIYLKGSLTVIDSVILVSIYCVYLWLLRLLPPEEMESLDELPWISRRVITMGGAGRVWGVVLLFVGGGLVLLLVAHPFIESLKALAAFFYVNTFFFAQWIAPFLSEFPEKVSVFNWSRFPKKAPMALMNILSANINQWTVLAAMIPVVYSISSGGLRPIVFNEIQRAEILLTLGQSFLCFVLLCDSRFSLVDAVALFVLWVTQFIMPSTRGIITAIYLGWVVLVLLRIPIGLTQITVFRDFRDALFIRGR